MGNEVSAAYPKPIDEGGQPEVEVGCAWTRYRSNDAKPGPQRLEEGVRQGGIKIGNQQNDGLPRTHSNVGCVRGAGTNDGADGSGAERGGRVVAHTWGSMTLSAYGALTGPNCAAQLSLRSALVGPRPDTFKSLAITTHDRERISPIQPPREP